MAVLAAPARSAAQAPTFNALVTTPKGGPAWFHPGSAAVGDFNGDGKTDAILTDGDYNSYVRLMLGNGNGSFTEIDVPSTPNATPGMIKAADLNGDGRLDAVFVSPQGNLAPTVLLNGGNNANGVPQFTATMYMPAYSGLRSVTVGDLNGDGRPDFVVGNAYGNLQVYLNNGNGTFTPGQSTTLMPNVGGSTGAGVIADLNGDGKADYLVSSNQASATNVFFGNGDGTLQAPAVYPGNGLNPAVGDLNGDGKPDFAEIDFGTGMLIVYLNNGNGTFGAPAQAPTGLVNPASLVLTDISGDGKLDAVICDFGSVGPNGVAVYLGQGNGSFGAPSFYNVNRRPRDVAVRDFNGDGKLDLATVGYESNDYGVLLNNTVYAPPLPTQTLTILGGSGTVGGIAANVEYYNPATGKWQPAYLTGWHPWGFVAGTNSWINYKPSSASDPWVSTDRFNPTWYLYRVRFTVPADALDPKMTFSLKADNWAQVAINGVSTSSAWIEGTADLVNADAVFSQNVHAGENTITLNIGDFGGLNGFNFRIDLSMKSAQPVEVVPVNLDILPPVITGPGNLTREASSAAGAAVSFTATAVDNVDGPVPVVASPASGSTFALGTTAVGLAATDAAGNTATASFTVTVRDTTAPVVTVPANITAEATSANGAAVNYPAPTATDAVGVTSLASTPASGSTFALGSTTVTATARDAAGNSGSGSFTVTVKDTTAPTITSLSTNAPTIWPPNHKMVPVTVSAVASDLVGVTSVKIRSVTSNEPDNGLGDGDVPNDIRITGDLALELRAERSGSGSGRVYTIVVEAKDAAGNASTRTVSVSVPKSQGGK